MKKKLSEIFSSTRFWSLVIGSVIIYLKQKGWIDESLMELITTILGGHIVINTADKFSKKNTTTTVTIPEGVSNVSASTENN